MSRMEGAPQKGIIENIKKAAQVGVLTTVGLTAGIKGESQNTFTDIEVKNQTEISKDIKDIEIKKINPEDYDLRKIGKLDLRDLEAKKSLNKEVIERIIFESLGRTKEINKIDKSSFSLTEKEKVILESAPELFKEIERARSEVMHLISGYNYFKKLKEEFNCSMAEAISHQKVRLSNLNIININLLSREEIANNAHNALAYSIENSNIIVLPYDYNLNKKEPLSIYEIAMHEFLHLITNGNYGLSQNSIDILSKKTFNLSENDKKFEYWSNPTERYVRFKMLESEMEKNGIKKVGEEFNEEHYKKMMKLFHKGKLSPNANAFIHFTEGPDNNYLLYKELFDKIASIDNFKEKENSDYNYPGWNYNNPSDKT